MGLNSHKKLNNFNPLMSGSNKKVTHTQLQVCLSMRDLFVTTWHQRVKVTAQT